MPILKQNRRQQIGNAIADVATGTLNAIKTFGVSAIGDAIHGISPKAADAVQKYSLGMIPHTSEAEYAVNRPNAENRWLNRIHSAGSAAASQAVGAMTNATIPAVTNAITGLKGLTPKQIYYQKMPWTWKPKQGAYYHRSPNVKTIINEEGNLVGFGSTPEGQARDAAIREAGKGKINLTKESNGALFYSKDVPLDWGRYNKTQGYKGPYLIEAEGVPMQSASGLKRRPGPPTHSEGYAVATRPVNINEVNVYKENLLRGYKKVNLLKNK